MDDGLGAHPRCVQLHTGLAEPQGQKGVQDSSVCICRTNPGIPEGVAGPAEQGEDLGPWFMAVLLAVLG